MGRKLSSRDRLVAEYIRDRVPFVTHGALRAEADRARSFGQLPREFYDSVEVADYTVYSYDTPIAWHGPDGWTAPAVRYSRTTSKHQGRLYLLPADTHRVSPEHVRLIARDGVARVPASTGGVWA